MTAGGPIRLVPQGGLAVVPKETRRPADPAAAASQAVLPGLRDLSSYCPQAGRAVLVPTGWLPPLDRAAGARAGTAAVVDWHRSPTEQRLRGAADRIWILLLSGLADPLELVELNREGEASAWPRGYEPEPGSQMHYDPSRRALLLMLKRRSAQGASQALPEAHLFAVDTASCKPSPGRSAMPAGCRRGRSLSCAGVRRGDAAPRAPDATPRRGGPRPPACEDQIRRFASDLIFGSSLQAITNSALSSPIFLRMRLSPPSSKRLV